MQNAPGGDQSARFVGLQAAEYYVDDQEIEAQSGHASQAVHDLCEGARNVSKLDSNLPPQPDTSEIADLRLFLPVNRVMPVLAILRSTQPIAALDFTGDSQLEVFTRGGGPFLDSIR